MTDEMKLEKIMKKFDNDVERAMVESRGQEKVLINMYCRK